MSKSTSHKKIVIVGGSFGGINAAYALRRRLGNHAEITLISKDAEFTFLPSLPWVILGWRNPARLQVPLDNALTRRGVCFVNEEVRELYPDKGEVRTESQTFTYDILLIASGAELDWAAVPGLGPAAAGHTQSTFTVEEAVRAREALARVTAGDSGRVVIGAAAGASCIGPAYEIVMMIDTVLRRAKKRHRFTLNFITPEPFLGHFGVGGIGMSPRMIQDEFADRDIDSTVNAKVVEVRPKELVLENGDEQGFDFSLVIPSFLGAEFVRGVGGLANPRGFVNVTSELTSPKFGNLYAVGVAVAIAPPGQTPVPVAVPKTGHMTELMAEAAAHNIAAEIRGGSKVDGLSLPSTCIADAGDTAFYLSADPFLPPRNKVVHKKGKWARYLKLVFEKYYLARIRHDLPPLHFGW
ncbi:MAG TPA: FAD-dependent oxidoreductase [Pyrinomonadaceae bacterium]|nr:FAD-dependent oxidoreductase [Pyrinomonadaceae bacterium]